MDSSPIRRIMVKPKRTFLLLLIGAAVIVTVIWTTRGVGTTKPTLLAAEQLQNVRAESSSDNQQNPFFLVVNSESNISSSLNMVASHGGPLVSNQHTVQQHHECSIMPNKKADIDTSDIYPTLNFNVSMYIHNI